MRRLACSPLAAAAALAGARGRVAMISGRDDDGLGRWSFVGATPIASLEVRGDELIERDAIGGPIRRWREDPLAALEVFAARHGVRLGDPIEPVPTPRLIGFLGYDLGRTIERLGPRPASAQAAPDLWFGAYAAIARWPAAGRDGEVIGEPAAAAALAAAIGGGGSLGVAPRLGALLPVDASDEVHLARVRRAIAYLEAGDAYQVNLARELAAPVVAPGDPLCVLAALLEVAPAPYAALVEADGAAVISGSPERFLGWAGDRLETRPIKGTRPRAEGAAADAALVADLAIAAKDAAEHLMIVDLERNDLGRVAEVGSVRVDALGYGVTLPTVHHRVSRVSARLRRDVGLASLLRATFPGGSITGAPKVRAMQLIEELEGGRRGPYCGAVGYLGGGGDLELAIAIRTAVLDATSLRVHVGGGIVADSVPADELAETEAKAVGWRRALARLATASGG